MQLSTFTPYGGSRMRRASTPSLPTQRNTFPTQRSKLRPHPPLMQEPPATTRNAPVLQSRGFEVDRRHLAQRAESQNERCCRLGSRTRAHGTGRRLLPRTQLQAGCRASLESCFTAAFCPLQGRLIWAQGTSCMAGRHAGGCGSSVCGAGLERAGWSADRQPN